MVLITLVVELKFHSEDALRARLHNQIHCRSRREEAQISDDLAKNQSLLTSAPTILRHALRLPAQAKLTLTPALSLRKGEGSSNSARRINISIGWFDSEQMAHEEIPEPPLAVGAARAVAAVRNYKQVEILVGPDEGIDETIGAFRWDVLVQFTDDQHQMALEFAGILDVGTLGVLRADGIAHPLLVPGGLVQPIVMTTAVGHGGFVKLRMEQQSPGGALASGGVAVNPNASNVVIGIFGGGGFVPQDAVGEPGVLEVFPANIVEGLRPVCGPHPIDLHDDEPQIC